MKKFVCPVCGYIHIGDSAPEFCPICKVPGSKFIEQPLDVAAGPAASASAAPVAYASEHVLGVAKGVEQDIIDDLVQNFNGECTEVGMYLAMSRVADREGYPEIAEAYKRYAFEEAEHAAKFAELLGDCLTNSTKRNLELRAEAEAGACEGKTALARLAKERGYDAIHDTVHEMARDEARHGAGFAGLLKRYF